MWHDQVPSLIRLAKGPPLRASCGLPEFGPTACTGVMLARMTNTAVQAVMDSTLGIVGSLQRGENVTLFANTTWYGGESVMSYAFATDQPIAMTFRTIFQHVLAGMYREYDVEKVERLHLCFESGFKDTKELHVFQGCWADKKNFNPAPKDLVDTLDLVVSHAKSAWAVHANCQGAARGAKSGWLAANGAWHLSSCFNEVREPVVDVLRRAVTEGSLKDRHAVAAHSLATCEDFCAKEKKNKKK